MTFNGYNKKPCLWTSVFQRRKTLPASTTARFFKYPHPKQCEIVFHRVVGIKLAQCGGDFLDGFPIVLFAGDETEGATCGGGVSVEREHQCGGRNVPNAKMNAAFVVATHPHQVHVEAFARRAFADVGDVLGGAERIVALKKNLAEVDECFADVAVLAEGGFKNVFQSAVIAVDVLKTCHTILKVSVLERPVDKRREIVNVLRIEIHHKIMRTVAHDVHHLVGVVDNHFAVAPRNS